ncbi:MAG: CHAD domain-containing protein [Planctomycetota bacterium]|nr:CHAD domain-containing protein [Planctomycetota bacterium]
MKTSNKWIVSDAGSMPVAAVAARTLRKRLGVVWTILPRACSSAGDPEQVHQLRVATRRALAALKAFNELLPTKRRAWFEKHLRRLRRAAGEARDLDVLTTRLAHDLDCSLGSADREPIVSIGGRTARSRLVAMLSRQRVVSRQPIRDRYERLLEADWTKRTERLLERLERQPPSGKQDTFAAYARRRFRPIVSHFFAAADRRMRTADDLHAFRIEGKKIRYILEIFATVFPERVRSRVYVALEQLQETLGDFTDHAAAADRFRRWSREDAAFAHREVLERLRRHEQRQANRARKDFAKWWDGDRRLSLRRTFDRTLRHRSA